MKKKKKHTEVWDWDLIRFIGFVLIIISALVLVGFLISGSLSISTAIMIIVPGPILLLIATILDNPTYYMYTGIWCEVKYKGPSRKTKFLSQDDPRGLLEIGKVYKVHGVSFTSPVKEVALKDFPGMKFHHAFFKLVSTYKIPIMDEDCGVSGRATNPADGGWD